MRNVSDLPEPRRTEALMACRDLLIAMGYDVSSRTRVYISVDDQGDIDIKMQPKVKLKP